MQSAPALILVLAACGSSAKSTTMSAPTPPALDVTPHPDPTADADAVVHALGDGDLAIPVSAPTGTAVRVPLPAPKQGDRLRFHYATGGSEGVERARYEAILALTAVDGTTVNELDATMLDASISAFSDHSSLDGTYHARFVTTPRPDAVFTTPGGDAATGVTVEELDEVVGDVLGPVPKERALLSTFELRQGEVHELDDKEQHVLFGKVLPGPAVVMRWPDRDGRVVLGYLLEVGDANTMLDKRRRTYELDPKTGALRRLIAVRRSTVGAADSSPRVFVTVQTFAPEP